MEYNEIICITSETRPEGYVHACSILSFSFTPAAYGCGADRSKPKSPKIIMIQIIQDNLLAAF